VTTTCTGCGRPGHGADEAKCPVNKGSEVYATAPDLDRLRALVSRFYGGSNVVLIETGDSWEVHTGRGKLSTRVIRKGKRFQFVSA
jgi:hypothetical protein